MTEKKYTSDGYLIVSELDKCSHFEKDEKAMLCCGNVDCFYCKYSDFRKIEYIKGKKRIRKKAYFTAYATTKRIKKVYYKFWRKET